MLKLVAKHERYTLRQAQGGRRYDNENGRQLYKSFQVDTCKMHIADKIIATFSETGRYIDETVDKYQL